MGRFLLFLCLTVGSFAYSFGTRLANQGDPVGFWDLAIETSASLPFTMYVGLPSILFLAALRGGDVARYWIQMRYGSTWRAFLGCARRLFLDVLLLAAAQLAGSAAASIGLSLAPSAPHGFESRYFFEAGVAPLSAWGLLVALASLFYLCCSLLGGAITIVVGFKRGLLLSGLMWMIVVATMQFGWAGSRFLEDFLSPLAWQAANPGNWGANVLAYGVLVALAGAICKFRDLFLPLGRRPPLTLSGVFIASGALMGVAAVAARLRDCESFESCLIDAIPGISGGMVQMLVWISLPVFALFFIAGEQFDVSEGSSAARLIRYGSAFKEFIASVRNAALKLLIAYVTWFAVVTGLLLLTGRPPVSIDIGGAAASAIFLHLFVFSVGQAALFIFLARLYPPTTSITLALVVGLFALLVIPEQTWGLAGLSGGRIALLDSSDRLISLLILFVFSLLTIAAAGLLLHLRFPGFRKERHVNHHLR